MLFDNVIHGKKTQLFFMTFFISSRRKQSRLLPRTLGQILSCEAGSYFPRTITKTNNLRRSDKAQRR